MLYPAQLYASPVLSFTPNPYAQLGWFNPQTYYSTRLDFDPSPQFIFTRHPLLVLSGVIPEWRNAIPAVSRARTKSSGAHTASTSESGTSTPSFVVSAAHARAGCAHRELCTPRQSKDTSIYIGKTNPKARAEAQ